MWGYILLPPKTHERGRERGRGPTVQIRPAYNDPYLHTFRLCRNLHIQKSPAIFPCLLSVCVCMCGHALAGLRACGSNVSGGRQQLACVPCLSVCVTCATHCCVWSKTGARETHVAACNDIAKFVFDYCTRPRFFWYRKAWA